MRMPPLVVLAATSWAVLACNPPGGDLPGLGAITAEDLRRDMFVLAGDEMRGREAGTVDELRASVWLAQRALEAGLEPAGNDGTFFQFWPLRRLRVSNASDISIAGTRYGLWTDAVVFAPVDAAAAGTLKYVGDATGTALDDMDIDGQPVAALITPPRRLPAANASLWGWRYTRSAIRDRSRDLIERGASIVVLVSDSIAETEFDRVAAWQSRGTYRADSEESRARDTDQPPVVWVRRRALSEVSRGPQIRAAISSESFVFPSVNVVARVPGTDAALAEEHVVFSAHQDHDGVRAPVDGDAIYNGADDNASASVALLAIGRAFARAPGRRSALFVWHGSEERGLIGSRWHVANPTIPLESMAAVLNADMIGRNHPDTASLLGSQPPHRNSTALVDMALSANDVVSGFVVDSTWDRPSHPEGFYFRSDHLPYARAGVPAVFFTSVLHPDYHTPRDGPEGIDIAKLTRITRWMYATGWAVAQAAERPQLDPGAELER